MDTGLRRTKEVEVNNVGQRSILMLEHHVELTSWVRLPPRREMVRERPHRSAEIVRAAAQIPAEKLVSGAQQLDSGTDEIDREVSKEVQVRSLQRFRPSGA